MSRCLIISLLLSQLAWSQDHSHRLERSIKFPNVPGFLTMKCDLHQHTVFSDGSVWPDIRVMEALKDGIDVISLTEHLEYQPHKADIPHPDRNRSYHIAMQEARNHKLMVVNGSEITRSMPPGHCNAVFITDANKLLISDSVEVFREARRQNAFTFWNHPAWTAQRKDGIATLTEMHRLLIRENLLQGIEVVNEHTFSDEALQIALDHNLTIMGTSDIHGLLDWEFAIPHSGHRPITLVFSRDTTARGVYDGLMDRRTVVFYKRMLIGRDQHLVPLIESSLRIDSAKYIGRTDVLAVHIRNVSSAEFTLRNQTGFTFQNQAELVHIEAEGNIVLEVKTRHRLSDVSLRFDVLSAVTAPKKHPTIVLKSKVTSQN